MAGIIDFPQVVQEALRDFGDCIEDVGWFWDHAEDRYKIAHDLLIANYVCTSGKHYPLPRAAADLATLDERTDVRLLGVVVQRNLRMLQHTQQ
ncbi:MAG: hypothetical protein ACYC3I_15345, partial [Gemmataceae bacterium]